MTYAGFIFDALASLAGVVAIFLAIKAYRVSTDSYAVAREQGKKTFELEILKELSTFIDDGYRDDATLQPPSGYITTRVMFLPLGELELWDVYTGAPSEEKLTERLLEHEAIKQMASDLHIPLPENLGLVTTFALMHELREAIMRRTE